jgi:hypothetical protein
MTVQTTDTFLVSRGGVLYKVTAANVNSKVADGDILLVNRAGVDYHITGANFKAAAFQDADLYLVNRTGTDYKATGAEVKAILATAPVVVSVTLADSPQATRFTSATFASTVSLVEGMPVSTKGIKAWVEGALKSAVLTDGITSVTSITATSVSVASGTATLNATPDGQLGTSRDPQAIVDGIVSLASSCRFAPGVGVEVTVTGVNIAAGSLLAGCYIISSGADTVNNKYRWTLTEVNGSPVSITSSDPVLHSGIACGVAKLFLPSNVGAITSFKCAFPAIPGSSTIVAGFDSGYSESLSRLTFATNTGLAQLAAGDALTEVTSTGTAGDATGTVGAVDVTATTITLAATAGTWDVGSKVKGPLKAPTGGATVKMYCQLNAGLTVTDLQSADPGYTTVTGAGPYTLTWPATMPTGNPPDVDLPAGTSLTTEVQATNSVGTSTKTSNTITPA